MSMMSMMMMMMMKMMICINWVVTNGQLEDGQMAPVWPDLAPNVNWPHENMTMTMMKICKHLKAPSALL